jgi:chaperonin cofactor prefoldin
MSIELEKEIDRLNSKIMMLTRDLDRKHRECAELQKQLSV